MVENQVELHYGRFREQIRLNWYYGIKMPLVKVVGCVT